MAETTAGTTVPEMHHWLDGTALASLVEPTPLLYVVLFLGMLVVAGRVRASRGGGELELELAQADNPAAALGQAGFLLGVGLAGYGILHAPGTGVLWRDVVVAVCAAILAALLVISGRLVTTRLGFPTLKVADEVRKGNVAASLIELGSSVGTGLIVMRAISLDGPDEVLRVIDALVFFAAAQAAFVGFLVLYGRFSKLDVRAAIQAGNPAVGVGIALTMIAVAWVLSYAIHETGSLIVFGAWFVLASAVFVVARRGVNRVLFPGHDLDRELGRDRNWGVAMLEGCVALLVALILTGAY